MNWFKYLTIVNTCLFSDEDLSVEQGHQRDKMNFVRLFLISYQEKNLENIVQKSKIALKTIS